MREFKFFTYIILLTLLIGTISVAGINQSNPIVESRSFDDFYFVQLTDTHIRHKIFDFFETTSNRLKTVIEEVISYDNPPAFIVITGDLCEWAGSDITGALNSQAFLSCFYEQSDQLYADSDHTIPVYTTPGNHDYVYSRDLTNYHTYIDKNHADDRYVVTYNDVSLFFMDSGPNYYSNPLNIFEWHGEGLYDDDIDWLDQELTNSVSAHNIVLMHHPAVGSKQDLFIRNRKAFVDLCESYDVELVLAGHTHNDQIYYYDDEAVKVEDRPLNCSQYTTLYVQSDDCKQSIHFRNISIQGNDIWIETNEELEPSNLNKEESIYENVYLKIFNNIFFNRYKRRHL